MGFWGVGFHFRRRVGGFRQAKRGKLFSFFQRNGFQHRGGGWFQRGGVPASKKNFSSARASRRWWCSSRVAGWLCKGDGVSAGKAFLAQGQVGFQQGWREGFDGEEELFQWGDFARGVGETMTMEETKNKIEPDGSYGTVQFAGRATGLTGPIPA